MISPVQLSEYNPEWPCLFRSICTVLMTAIDDLPVRLEHVGSTAVPGLVAKPTIDIDIVVPTDALMTTVISRLGSLGYEHMGDRGIRGREAFIQPPLLPPHHLYMCRDGSLPLRNHLLLREALRTDASAREGYSMLKRRLAAQGLDVDEYCRAKTDYILSLLRDRGMTSAELGSISSENAGVE